MKLIGCFEYVKLRNDIRDVNNVNNFSSSLWMLKIDYNLLDSYRKGFVNQVGFKYSTSDVFD